MKASGTLYEATVPVKLPGSHCSCVLHVSPKSRKLRYVPYTYDTYPKGQAYIDIQLSYYYCLSSPKPQTITTYSEAA
jgi:hypothetical protein